MKKIIAYVLTVLVLAASISFADVPRTINYQGRLTDLNNIPVVDGTHSITISLYDSATATTAKWADNFATATKNGYFNIVLGSGTQKLDAVDFSVQYWVGIRVDTDTEMTPRQALNSVPYALGISSQNLPGYLLSNVKTIPSGSGTYYTPTGVRAILVEVQGGGGGGGGAAYLSTTGSGAGSGGGAGGYAKKWITVPEASYDYVVGASVAGGLPGANSGTNGNLSSFSAHGGAPLINCNGGAGGAGGTGQTSLLFFAGPSRGGTATGGDINIPGNGGFRGIAVSLYLVDGGMGGSSVLGAGGINPNMWGDGEAGTGYGSGGAGGKAQPSTNRAGGAGAPGVIIVWEYK